MKSWPFSRRKTAHSPDLATFNYDFISLMWPDDTRPDEPKAGDWYDDLGVADLVRSFRADIRHNQFIQMTLATLTPDTAVIEWRQAVLADLLDNPEFVVQIESLLPHLANMQQDNSLLGRRQRGLLLRTSERLAELEIYTDVIVKLHEALNGARLLSPALSGLRSTVGRLVSDPNFQHLREQLPALREPMQKITSLTVGINLDVELRPKSAVLMAINDFEIGSSSSFLDRVLGARPEGSADTGVAPLHHVPGDANIRPLSPLFQDLEKLMTQVAEPVERVLRQFTRINTEPLVNLEYELTFFLGAIRMMRTLEAQDITFCRPQTLPPNRRETRIDGLININLALQAASSGTVPNDVQFGDDGRIAILTGPNSGGKTTYLRSVGLAQVMFQAGLFIPATSATMSPVDHIFTHFPALETREQGRLAEEAERLRAIFQQITGNSLILLNETFATTSSGEAVFLAQDVLCALRAIGSRAIYATHLTELVENIPEMTDIIAGESAFFSLVAGIEFDEDMQGQPTYRITPGKPLSRSYAQEIARRHGIKLDQILDIQSSYE